MKNIIWNQLLATSDTLNDSVIGNVLLNNDDKLQMLIAQLESIIIAHERSFDPADNYEEYVAISLCKSIQMCLKSSL